MRAFYRIKQAVQVGLDEDAAARAAGPGKAAAAPGGIPIDLDIKGITLHHVADAGGYCQECRQQRDIRIVWPCQKARIAAAYAAQAERLARVETELVDARELPYRPDRYERAAMRGERLAYEACAKIEAELSAARTALAQAELERDGHKLRSEGLVLDVEQARADLAAAVRRAERLAGYAVHKADCPNRTTHQPCSCGLSAALGLAGAEGRMMPEWLLIVLCVVVGIGAGLLQAWCFCGFRWPWEVRRG